MTQKDDSRDGKSPDRDDAEKKIEPASGKDESSTEKDGDDSHLHDDQKAFSL